MRYEWYITDARPSVRFRYVADTFPMFDSKETAFIFLWYLNSHHNSINFIIEIANNHRPTFLSRHCRQMRPQQFFRYVNLLKKDLCWPHRQMRLLHAARKFKINLMRALNLCITYLWGWRTFFQFKKAWTSCGTYWRGPKLFGKINSVIRIKCIQRMLCLD